MDKSHLQEIFSQTLATIVIYNTSLENSITFQSISKGLEQTQTMMDIIVYDNSETAQVIPDSKCWNIQYIHDPSNPGVSKAYNYGFNVAKQKAKRWLLLLDQDTNYNVSSLSEYAQSILQYPNHKIFIPLLYDRLSLASPFQFKFGGGKRISISSGIHSIHDYWFHNCGLMISIDAFENSGGYDERFTLDFSDLSFVSRLRKNEDEFVLTPVNGNHLLATTSTATIDERAKRFKSYISACRIFKEEYFNDLFISLRLFFRSIKLCWTHKSFRFIYIYLSKND